MTSEVLIMNKNGIALAADSAITIGSQKVWNASNKIFTLGPSNDIAIMIYNKSDFLGIPWDVVIKEFRSHIGKMQFSKLDECVQSFEAFLRTDVFRNPYQEMHSACSFFKSKLAELFSYLGYEKPTKKEFNEVVDLIRTYISEAQPEKQILDISYEDFENLFHDSCVEILKSFVDYKITENQEKEIVLYLYKLFINGTGSEETLTGFVFAGYGQAEFLPSFVHAIYDGICGEHLRFWVEGRNTFDECRISGAQLSSFAQGDAVSLFMEGLHPQHKKFMRDYYFRMMDKVNDVTSKHVDKRTLKKIEKDLKSKSDDIVGKIAKEYQDLIYDDFTLPILDAIDDLPPEEMISLAESLVALQSLRKRIGTDIETVGGPVDVVFVSRGEGVIWIKRKHYFDQNLNSDYKLRRQDI